MRGERSRVHTACEIDVELLLMKLRGLGWAAGRLRRPDWLSSKFSRCGAARSRAHCLVSCSSHQLRTSCPLFRPPLCW
jgi:hypothetical protein